VAEYLAKAGLSARLSDNLHDADLVERFGDAARRYLESCHSDYCDTDESHALMSASLDMALAIRSQIWADRYEAFLSWVATANLPPRRRILDVGCDIGIPACFYATCFRSRRSQGLIGARRAFAVRHDWRSGSG